MFNKNAKTCIEFKNAKNLLMILLLSTILSAKSSLANPIAIGIEDVEFQLNLNDTALSYPTQNVMSGEDVTVIYQGDSSIIKGEYRFIVPKPRKHYLAIPIPLSRNTSPSDIIIKVRINGNEFSEKPEIWPYKRFVKVDEKSVAVKVYAYSFALNKNDKHIVVDLQYSQPNYRIDSCMVGIYIPVLPNFKRNMKKYKLNHSDFIVSAINNSGEDANIVMNDSTTSITNGSEYKAKLSPGKILSIWPKGCKE